MIPSKLVDNLKSIGKNKSQKAKGSINHNFSVKEST